MKQAPDAILLDISMDDIDGWQTAGGCADRHHDLPIIIVSANVFENHPEKLDAAGCQAFVDKPVIESELLHALQRHLQLEWIADPAIKRRPARCRTLRRHRRAVPPAMRHPHPARDARPSARLRWQAHRVDGRRPIASHARRRRPCSGPWSSASTGTGLIEYARQSLDQNWMPEGAVSPE